MIIEATGITKSFGSLPVLKGIDLQVEKGELVSIVGASGAGKTTLLQIIGTLDRADQGVLKLCDTEIGSLNEAKLAAFRNQNIGFVFQFHQLLPEFTALENVEIPALMGKHDAAQTRERAISLLDRLGLKDRMQHKPNQLSGGEKQRVAVARALINKPTLLLADEPSGSLDSGNKAELHDLLLSLRSELNLTMLIVTHDPTLAQLCDRCITMKDGLIVK